MTGNKIGSPIEIEVEMHDTDGPFAQQDSDDGFCSDFEHFETETAVATAVMQQESYDEVAFDFEHFETDESTVKAEQQEAEVDLGSDFEHFELSTTAVRVGAQQASESNSRSDVMHCEDAGEQQESDAGCKLVDNGVEEAQQLDAQDESQSDLGLKFKI